MIIVLGIDVASSDWSRVGSALLGFEPGASHFAVLKAPALVWPDATLTAHALADTIDHFVRREGVAAVALDGPQGWRDPETPPGTPGVGRRCEYECRAQAKTGVYPQTYPANQRPWIEFSIELFASLLQRQNVHLARIDERGMVSSGGYAVLECFPTSIWRTAGLTPLPGKSKRPNLQSFTNALCNTFRIPPTIVESHDDLQAAVAALAAAAYVGGPAVPCERGVPAVVREAAGIRLLTEGLIWDARPLDSPDLIEARAFSSQGLQSSKETSAQRVRVTQGVLDQVARVGRSQAQIALDGFPPGNKKERVTVAVVVDEEIYPLTIGDSHAAWVTHQTGDSSDGFDRLFALLADRPNTWMPAALQAWHPPTYASQTDHLASHGPPPSDAPWRTVSIPIRIVGGKLEVCGRDKLPSLTDCIGDLVVPAFAVENPADLEWLTRTDARMLFDKDTPLLCRVSGRQLPPALAKKCRTEAVPDSHAPGAFVEVLLGEPLYLRSRGTKKAVLESVQCVVPALDGLVVGSLNEAYRRISEVFEPGRRSVGGNVFRSFYYFDAERAAWRPIGELRGDFPFVPR